jgi:carboxymethylenebutenolidase
VAGAQEDKHFTPEQAELLENALTEAGVDHTARIRDRRQLPES